jgi:hypothetical protein
MAARPSRAGALASRVRSFASDWACAIAGACLGAVGGAFALGAALVLGIMLDMARVEARERRAVVAFLEKPGGAAPCEPVEGFAAAACLALRGSWQGPAELEARRALFETLAQGELGLDQRSRRAAERIVDAAMRASRADLPTLARRLASAGEGRARRLLVLWVYSLAALGGTRLDPGIELALRAALADCGIAEADLISARARAFPGDRDPWTVLGLSPGSSRSEVKAAFRRLSRIFHPDTSPADDGERFRELSAAYAQLVGKGPRS